MIDLAIGMVLGGAFGTIISSLVKDVITPPIGMLMGKMDFSNWFIVLSEGKDPGAVHDRGPRTRAGALTLNLGVFINTLINFTIVAFALFFVVKSINRLKREAPAEPTVPSEPSADEKLQAEIRDLLKARACGGEETRCEV